MQNNCKSQYYFVFKFALPKHVAQKMEIKKYVSQKTFETLTNDN